MGPKLHESILVAEQFYWGYLKDTFKKINNYYKLNHTEIINVRNIINSKSLIFFFSIFAKCSSYLILLTEGRIFMGTWKNPNWVPSNLGAIQMHPSDSVS